MAGNTVRLIKPNVIPEMAEDCFGVIEKKFVYSKGTVVCFYGDQDIPPGEVKIKTDTGASGNLVVLRFLKRFDPGVVRIRIGMGRSIKDRWGGKSDDIGDVAVGEAVMTGVRCAVRASGILVQHGIDEARAYTVLANKRKGHTWMPKS